MRGILFIEPLYHQTIAGKKTMTRRSGGLEIANKNPDDWRLWPGPMLYNTKTFDVVLFKPRYKVGEVLYIKEPTAKFLNRPDLDDELVYMYSCPETNRYHYKWSNKLFMPASTARAFIRITGIKCERLLDISDADCIAEGIKPRTNSAGQLLGGYKDYLAKTNDKSINIYSPKDSFISLYKLANKVKNVPNLWVFCYEYEYLPNYKIDGQT